MIPRLPLAVTSRLPEGARRRAFHHRLAAGDLTALPELIRSHDALGKEALFLAVDQLMATGQGDRLGELKPLAKRAHRFARQVWRALMSWHKGHRPDAVERLETLGSDTDLDGFQRMCAAAWRMYLQLGDWEPFSADKAPGTLFQFWDRPEVPSEMRREMEGWERAAPQGYRRFDDASARAYIADRLGPAEARAFDAGPHPAIRSDFFRLCHLSADGGVYVDADARCRPSAAGLLASIGAQPVIWFGTDRAKGHLVNGFMASPAGHPFFEACVAEAASRLTAGGPLRHVFALAGPSTVTEVALAEHSAGRIADMRFLSNHLVRTRLLGQIRMGYKSDRRNWRIWQDSVEKGAP